jgi:hypothetical protein
MNLHMLSLDTLRPGNNKILADAETFRISKVLFWDALHVSHVTVGICVVGRWGVWPF